MRELTLNEMEEVYGGPLPDVVVAAGKIVGASFLGGFAAAAGAWRWAKVVPLCSH
jgi:lactobin A/cerein 7B family class IIb bacteriocin